MPPTSRKRVAADVPSVLAQWLGDRGLIRRESVLGPSPDAKGSVSIDAVAVAAISHGDSVASLILDNLGQRARDGIRPVHTQSAAAKAKNWSIVQSLLNDPVLDDWRLDAILCGEWKETIVVLDHIRRSLHTIGDPLVKKNRNNAARVRQEAREELGSISRHRSSTPTAMGGLRLQPLDGKRLPHSSDSTPFLDDARKPGGGLRRGQSLATPSSSAGGDDATQSILSAANVLLQQQALHQQLAQQQQMMYAQQQQQWFAFVQQQQQQQLEMAQSGAPMPPQIAGNWGPSGVGLMPGGLMPSGVMPGGGMAPMFVPPQLQPLAQPQQQQQQPPNMQPMNPSITPNVKSAAAVGHPLKAMTPILHSGIAGHTPDMRREFGTTDDASHLTVSPARASDSSMSEAPSPHATAIAEKGERQSNTIALSHSPAHHSVEDEIDPNDATGNSEEERLMAALQYHLQEGMPPAKAEKIDPLAPTNAAQPPQRKSGPRGQTAKRVAEALLYRPVVAEGIRAALLRHMRYQHALRRQTFAAWRLHILARRSQQESMAHQAAVQAQHDALDAAAASMETNRLDSGVSGGGPHKSVKTESATVGDRHVNNPAVLRAVAAMAVHSATLLRASAFQRWAGLIQRRRRRGVGQFQRRRAASVMMNLGAATGLRARYFTTWRAWLGKQSGKAKEARVRQQRLHGIAERAVSRLWGASFDRWRFWVAKRNQRRLAALQRPSAFAPVRRNDYLVGQAHRGKVDRVRQEHRRAELIAALAAAEKAHDEATAKVKAARKVTGWDSRPPPDLNQGVGTPKLPEELRVAVSAQRHASQRVSDTAAALRRLMDDEEQEAKETEGTGGGHTRPQQPRKCRFCGHVNDVKLDVFDQRRAAAAAVAGRDVGRDATAAEHKTWCVMCGEILDEGDEALFNWTLWSRHNALPPVAKKALILVQSFCRWRKADQLTWPLRRIAQSQFFDETSTAVSKLRVTIYRMVFAIRFIRRVLGRPPAALVADSGSSNSLAMLAAGELPSHQSCGDARCESLTHYLRIRIVASAEPMNEDAFVRYAAPMCPLCARQAVGLRSYRQNRAKRQFFATLRVAAVAARMARGIRRRCGAGLGRSPQSNLGDGVLKFLDRVGWVGCHRCNPVLRLFAVHWTAHTLQETTTLSLSNRGNTKPLGSPTSFEPQLPDMHRQRRWNSTLCTKCRNETLSLLTVVGRVHDYCTRVHKIRMRFAFRVFFRGRARSSIRRFAVQRLGYQRDEVNSILGASSASAVCAPHARPLTINEVIDTLHPQGDEPHWCYRCECFVAGVIRAERRGNRRPRASLKSFATKYLHTHTGSRKGHSEPCADLALKAIMRANASLLLGVWAAVSRFVARTYGPVQLRRTDVGHKQRYELRAKRLERRKSGLDPDAASTEEGATDAASPLIRRPSFLNDATFNRVKLNSRLADRPDPPFEDVCNACELHLLDIDDALREKDAAAGAKALPPEMVLKDDKVFGTRYDPPTMCDVSSEDGKKCYAAAHNHVVEYCAQRNEALLQAFVSTLTQLAWGNMPSRPENCDEGLFDSCKRDFNRTTDALGSEASKKAKKTTASKDTAGELKASVKGLSKKLCKVCQAAIEEQCNSSAKAIDKLRWVRSQIAERRKEVDKLKI